MSERTQSSNERLWRDLFEEKGAKESLSALLREAALQRKARARRRQQQLVAAAGILGLLALGWWALSRQEPQPFAGEKKDPLIQNPGLIVKRPPLPPSEKQTPNGPPQQAQEAPAVASAKPAGALDIPGVKALTDEELLDRMRGVPVALVGPKGHRRLIFLNEVSARVSKQESAAEDDAGSWE